MNPFDRLTAMTTRLTLRDKDFIKRKLILWLECLSKDYNIITQMNLDYVICDLYDLCYDIIDRCRMLWQEKPLCNQACPYCHNVRCDNMVWLYCGYCRRVVKIKKAKLISWTCNFCFHSILLLDGNPGFCLSGQTRFNPEDLSNWLNCLESAAQLMLAEYKFFIKFWLGVAIASQESHVIKWQYLCVRR